ncbi:unnamed protein product [Adineta ricciae]|uniref:PNPLA domain-containing protein n=2 Tax=Adineta ricciae TaxID=249248 RepID=A0A815FT77_ADIRI|nr:unnamed protein product [Adineta ricciae]
MTAEKVNDFLKRIDDSIAEDNSFEKINSLFDEVSLLLKKLEVEDESSYIEAKHQYHTKRSSCLKFFGKIEEAKQEETLAVRYGSKLVKPNPTNTSIPSSKQENEDELTLPILSDAKTVVQVCFKDFQEHRLLSDPTLRPTVNELKTLLNEYLSHNEIHLFEQFDSLERLQLRMIRVTKLFQDEIILNNKTNDNTEQSLTSDEINSEDPVTEVLFLLVSLQKSIDNCLNAYRRSFFRFLLMHKGSLREILFSNIPLTQERIRSHARKLLKIFHPDKTTNETEKNDFREIFHCIISCKDDLLNELTQNGTICDKELIRRYTAEGQKLWEIARDYSRARNNNWKDCVHLKEDQLKNRTEAELRKLQKTYSLLAYEQYRAAALALAMKGSAEDRSELRRMMAITLYTSEEYLQAQMYTIAAMHILLNGTGSPEITSKIVDLQKLLARIQNIHRQPTTTSNTKLPSSTQAVSLTNQQLSSVALRAQVRNELRSVVLQQCLLRGEEKQIETSQELILAAKTKVMQYEALTVAMCGATTLAGMATGAQFYQTISAGILLGSTVGPVGVLLGITGGLIIVAGGALLTKKSFDIARNLSEEPAIRNILNERLPKAMEYCTQQMYSEFLRLLASPYWENLYLLRIEVHGDAVEIKIDPQHIIKELLKHEFRPDGIAYLLILIGEALLNKPKLLAPESKNENASLRQPTQSTFNELASNLFRDVFQKSSQLQDKAKQLDAEVQQKHLGNLTLNKFQYFWRSVVSSKYSSYVYSIPEEYFNDALKTPFITRLDELADIARLNYAIVQIIIGGVDNLDESQETILEIKRKKIVTENNQFFQVSQLTMQAIDDLIMAFGLTPKPLVDQNLLALENKFLYENIHMMMDGNVAINCENVKSVSNASQVLEAFGELCDMKIILSQREFTDKVLDLYTKSGDEALRTSIEHMMISDDIPNQDIIDWFEKYPDRQEWVLCDKHLPILSYLFNTEIRICSIEINSIYGRVFVEQRNVNTNQPILSFHSSIFVVLDDKQKIICLFKICELKLNYLFDQLRLSRDMPSEIRIYHQIALHYRLKAEHYEHIHRLKALPMWNNAKDNYLNIIQLDPNDLFASLGYGRCLIMLSKWKKAMEFLRETLKLHEDSNEAWFLLGLAYRKLRIYDEAKYAIQQSLRKLPDYKDAASELRIIQSLQSEKIHDRLNVYDRMTTRVHRDENCSDFNILSIDGGGIRGLLPAIWLAEIERRTNRSSASMFHMMAGTSTGAIIAAGLSTPNRDNVCTPRYKAADIVKLYVDHSNEVFQKQSGRLYHVRRYFSQEAKYVDDGRQKLFGRYFDHTLLSQVLTELVIPAVKNDTKLTHLFNRYDCRYNHAQDYELQDILMCTSAAPTYFPSYKMDNCSYIDGGVQMNNPAMGAYDEAIRYGKSKDKIFILSLGTGDYVPNPLHPNASRHLLFYAMHSQQILNIVFDGPQYNMDVHMLSVLNKEKYQRWQLWFEEPIELDAKDELSIEVLFDSARAYFEEMEEYDNDKRLGLLLDRLKGDAH